MPNEQRPGRPRILVVEDNAAVRKAVVGLLGGDYDIEEATSGSEAIAAFERRCPDLLLSDLVIPEPNGQDLANLCRERCPETILVFMSGYSEDELHELDIKQVVFIPKPFDPDDLRTKVARLLDTPNSTAGESLPG